MSDRSVHVRVHLSVCGWVGGWLAGCVFMSCVCVFVCLY